MIITVNPDNVCKEETCEHSRKQCVYTSIQIISPHLYEEVFQSYTSRNPLLSKRVYLINLKVNEV